MNRLVKVYGHTRSGNNYLCSLLFKNYYSGQDNMGEMVPRRGRRFLLFGEEVQDDPFFHPYRKIFGSHNPHDLAPNSIYIVRNYKDVEQSMYRMKNNILRPDPDYHMRHVYMCLEYRPYVVYYEELKEDPHSVLRDIETHFQLCRLYRNYITDIGYCGWPE